MYKQKYFRSAIVLSMFVVFQFIFVLSANAQDSPEMKPELSVAGIELGNRTSAENFLKDGYAPRFETDGRVGYYFYNKWANQVMKLIAPSMEDKYFITEIEVFKVSRKYQERHYQAEDIKFFETESGIFIGFKQSAMFLIAGIENAGSTNKVKTKNLLKIKGEPTEKIEVDKKKETFVYKIPNIKLSDNETDAEYTANYEFYKNELRKFSFKIKVNNKEIAKN